VRDAAAAAEQNDRAVIYNLCPRMSAGRHRNERQRREREEKIARKKETERDIK